MRQIIVDILGDATQFKKTTAGATAEASKFKNVLTGIGQGIGIGGFNLVSSAVQSTTKYLTDAVAMAREEEVGIQRLGASLAANVPNWDGNTQAIEDNISAMVRSTGFSDGDMRDSLSKLVASTHDVAAAQKLQATAMDLARFKGIGLVQASEALIKVEGGQYRALKELGIQLPKNATAEQALAAVQKVATGQMSAYMETSAGKAEVLKNRMEDLQEEIGNRLIPVLNTVTEVLLDFGTAMEDGTLSQNNFVAEAYQARDAIGGIGDAFDNALDFVTPWDEYMSAAAERQAKAWAVTGESITGSSEDTMSAMARTADAADESTGEMIDDWRHLRRVTTDVFEGMAEYLLGKYNDDFGRAMDIQEARLDRHNAKTDEEYAEASATLAELGVLSQAGYEKWIAALERLAAKTKGKVHDAYLAAIADIRALQSVAARPINVTVNYRGRGSPQHPVEHRAAGGAASGMTWVGEQGPELVNLPSGSYVNDAQKSRRMASGRAGISVVVNGNIYGPSGVDELMDMMAQRLRQDNV